MTKVRVFETPDAVGEYLATKLLERIAAAKQSGRRFLLGCPTGRTPRPIYRLITRQLSETGQDISHVILVMMDEYLIKDSGGFEYAPASALWSCHNFARREIAVPWNASLEVQQRLKDESIWFPDPNDPASYDEKIADAGGIDVFILASGASDGHVAFNPPGSARDSRTRIIALSETTRRDNLVTFPEFENLESVPSHGISVGIATITAAKEAVMVLTGEAKAQSFDRIQQSKRYDSEWPATVIHECAIGELICDADAARHRAKP